MKISSSMKLIKDEYDGFYSCGLTMSENGTMRSLEVKEETADKTVFLRADGIKFTAFHEKDKEVTRMKSVFTNNTKEPVTLEMIDSFLVSGIPGDKLHRFTSFWSAEGRHKVDDVKELNLEHAWNNMAYRVEKFGAIGSMPVRGYFPFLAIEDTKTGTFTAFSLYIASSWQMEVIVRHDDTLTVTGGIADRDFGQFTKVINPGESFETPRAVMATGKSLLEVCDKLIKAQTPDISPLDDHMGITFNEYCTTWGDPTEENMKRIADRLEGEGIQYLVMDSGWYIDGEGYWWDNTGDWNVSKKRFPNGLKPLSEYIRSKGMIPGIWYEFECVGTRSKYYTMDDFLVKKDGVVLTVNGKHFLDMENPDVIKHLSEKVIDNLKESDMGYIKVDYNDTMGIGVDGPDGLGENLRKKIEATKSFFRKMKKEIPNLVIENCSSGGHRLEPSMMELATMASFSDAHEISSIPLIAANLHYLVKPSQSQIWAVLRKTDSESRIFYSMCATLLGRMGLSGDIYDIDEYHWGLVREGIAFYKKAASIIENGTTTLIKATAESYNKPEGAQLVIRELENKKLVIFHRFESSCDLPSFCKENGISLDWTNAVKYGNACEDFSAEAYII